MRATVVGALEAENDNAKVATGAGVGAIIGGILGGFALFTWSFIARMPPLGTAGLRTVSPLQEQVIFAAMHGVMAERAL